MYQWPFLTERNCFFPKATESLETPVTVLLNIVIVVRWKEDTIRSGNSAVQNWTWGPLKSIRYFQVTSNGCRVSGGRTCLGTGCGITKRRNDLCTGQLPWGGKLWVLRKSPAMWCWCVTSRLLKSALIEEQTRGEIELSVRVLQIINTYTQVLL